MTHSSMAAEGYLAPLARRFRRSALFVKETTFACRLGRATSQVRSQSWHSYSYSPCMGSRARIFEDMQNGQSVGPGMPSVFVRRAPRCKCYFKSLSEWQLRDIVDTG